MLDAKKELRKLASWFPCDLCGISKPQWFPSVWCNISPRSASPLTLICFGVNNMWVAAHKIVRIVGPKIFDIIIRFDSLPVASPQLQGTQLN
jgi:hypothetical protein